MELNHFISKKRIIFFIGLLLIFTGLIVAKYARAMLGSEPEVHTVKKVRERGSILDRNGKILAAATTLYNLSVNKTLISDVNRLVNILSPILEISESELLDKMQDSKSNFLYLKKKLSENEKEILKDAIREYGLKGLRLEAVANRIYPENELASTLIGYLGDDGKGLTGIEYSMQNILSPPEGTAGADKDGYTVALTIDASIQYMLQQIAERTMKSSKAEAVIFLAADAKTGEILAYINEPSADLARFSSSTQEERFDRPAYFIYEPGSVFKIFSIASFLELGTTKDSDVYTCDAQFVFKPRQLNDKKDQNVIRCLRVHGQVTPRDIIRFSCNDGMAQIADKTDAAAFAEKLRAFGFGKKTGLELPGEAAGIFAPVSSWSTRTKHTIAIGQEIGVTSLQIVQAATAFTNKGKTLKLSLLSEILDSTGKPVYRHKPKPLEQVISAQTAKTVLGYMQTAADDGTGFRASIKGVPISVKTGTAQMAQADGRGYSSTDYLSSCIGIFPVDDPQVILYMAVIRPVGETYGSLVAAPAISEAANAIIDYRGMGRANAPNITHTGIIKSHRQTPVTVGDTMPDLLGTPKRLLLDLLGRTDITVKLTGDGYVTAQSPAAGTPVVKGMIIELTLE
ncbi:transpeptidase family protein [Treponema sp. OMZ 305]|uniref:penicillin-binding protein n=1 Tax=Treponema TaxID=157 RepID=UPI001BAF61B2|nr:MULTISPECIES: penicillin-binding protein [Treponema]QUY17674.1 transpeptidase family protein [Treponema vincentii]UTC57559.1 transpeptidase family protein [Treponema sp. OMZ 305]